MFQEMHRLAASVFAKRNTKMGSDYQTKTRPVILGTPYSVLFTHLFPHEAVRLVSHYACEQKYTLSLRIFWSIKKSSTCISRHQSYSISIVELVYATSCRALVCQKERAMRAHTHTHTETETVTWRKNGQPK